MSGIDIRTTKMKIPGWEHFEHGADIGVHGIGVTREEAFVQAALAMTAVMTDPQSVRPESKIEFDCDAPDDELLFVDWLNALIYHTSSRKWLFSRFEVEINQHHLHARVWGETIDPVRHRPAVEVKGATYTALRVFQDEDAHWHAQTVVDV